MYGVTVMQVTYTSLFLNIWNNFRFLGHYFLITFNIPNQFDDHYASRYGKTFGFGYFLYNQHNDDPCIKSNKLVALNFFFEY